MNTVIVIELIVGIVVLAGVVVFAVWYTRGRRRAGLQERFGPEYAREVQARGSERAADQP
jgi:NADH:ubiquinone oxidoreductase subunit H